MYGSYYVLITEQEFGVFEISAPHYPQIFLDNIGRNVHVVSCSDLNRFLITRLGRNILINKKFCPYTQLGEVFSRTPS